MKKSFIFLVLPILTVFACSTSQAQEDSKRITDCVSLRMIEQKPAPPIKEKPAPDVFVEKPDDIHLRFELKNNCARTIYYLAYKILKEKTPAGFMIYRNQDGSWKARSPCWEREGCLTGINYEWIALKTDRSKEFEYSDLSLIDEERNISIYINNSPTQKERIEIRAEPFSVKR